MANIGINLGIANIEAQTSNRAPFLRFNPVKFNFDVTADDYDALLNSAFMKPFLVDPIIDPQGTFSALHPAKRKLFIDNFIEGSENARNTSTTSNTCVDELPSIIWKAVAPKDLTGFGFINNIVTNKDKPLDEYEFVLPAKYLADPSVLEDDYKGPRWSDNNIEREPEPSDEVLLQIWRDDLQIKKVEDFVKEASKTHPNNCVADIPSTYYVWQTTPRDGLWYGIESNPFITTENTPFWVSIKKEVSPTSFQNDTVFIISLGIGTTDQRYDLVLNMNAKPYLIDYKNDGGKSGANRTKDGDQAGDEEKDAKIPQPAIQWDLDTSRIISSEEDIEIGFMTCAGRLVIFVNGASLIYNRIEPEEGKIGECKIAKGGIRIFATNVKAEFNVSPMTFSPEAAIAFPIPVATNINDSSTRIDYTGVDYRAEPATSVCLLPTPPSVRDPLFGCDCAKFIGPQGEVNPTGTGFHRHGTVVFAPVANFNLKTIPNSDFHLMRLATGTIDFGGVSIRSGAPFYFRLKGIGILEEPEEESGEPFNLSDFVVSISEDATANDYFHSSRSLSITCYNEDGILNSLRNGQSAISVRWGWEQGDEPVQTKTFTGLITGVNTSEKAGEEYITLNCEDYMHVLKNVPIINSPFYDGMVLFYAVRDMAIRAGMRPSGIINDWDSTDEYFLPAGFAFTKPLMKYPSQQSIMDCILDVVKRFEAVVFYDELGRLHVKKLPGGLFSVPTTITAKFVSKPELGIQNVVLDEKNIEYDYNSTVNVISIMTVDRNTRNAIIVSHKAGSENRLLYRKPYVERQGALGELAVARGRAEELGQRIFKPIKRTSFTVIGNVDTITQPLDFITLDDKPFRVMSIKRSFDAANNDFTQTYECEWLGG